MAAAEVDSCYWSANVPAFEFVDEVGRQGAVPLTIFLENPGGSIPISHPKVLKDEITAWVGPHISLNCMKATRSGKIVCVTESTETAKKLLTLRKLMEVDITPRLVSDTLTSRFLLYDIPINVQCREIAEELILGGMAVCEVRRFQKTENGNRIPLKTVLVSKIGLNLPDKVRLWFEEIRIRLFIDRPRQCANCLQFSHSTKMCRNGVACRKCSGEHNVQACQSDQVKCKNCGEGHEATSKDCTSYLREVEINRFKCQHHLTIIEARRRYTQKGSQGKVHTYANAAASHPLNENKETKELMTKIDTMMERFEATLQTFLAVQVETFTKLFEGMMTSVTHMLQKVSASNLPEASSGSHKRDSKKARKSRDTSLFSSPALCSGDLGMDFADVSGLEFSCPISPGSPFLDATGQGGPPLRG